MKRVRLALLVVLPLLLLLVQGCTPKLYTFVFNEEQKLTRIDGDWYAVNEDYDIGPLGLFLNDCRVSTPHYYTGDFDVTVTYKANVDATYMGILNLVLGTDRELDGSDWFGGVSIIGTSNNDEVMYSSYCDSGSDMITVDNAVPVGDKVNPDGINILKLIKRGSTIKFKLNDKWIGSTMDIIGNSTDFNIPQIYGGGYQGLAPVIIKSFEVKFYDDQVLI